MKGIRRIPVLLPVTLVVMAVFLALAEPAHAGRMAVIVHADRDANLDLEEIAQIYLKRKRYWAGGEAIVPVNREAGSSARDRFTKSVLGLGSTQLGLYWNREYFRGVLPPATLASDEAIRRYVARDRRAIGYVDARMIDDTVRVVLYIDPK